MEEYIMEEKIFTCICGKTFTNGQSFNGHKSHCKEHQINKYGSLDKMLESQKASSEKISKTLKENNKKKKEEELQQWISEQHTCEKCGKVMTEKFGSGRFCCRNCANSKQASEQRKLRTSLTLKNIPYKTEYTAEELYYIDPKICTICKQIIPFDRRDQIVCSEDCLQVFRSQRKNQKKIEKKTTKNIKINYLIEYTKNPNYCKICGKEIPYEHRRLKACSEECRHQSFINAGIKSSQSQNRRSKNEVAFCELCEEYFGKENVLHNEPMFNGWAPIIW